MSPIDIRAARSRFLRAFAAAMVVAAVVAGSAYAVTKHTPHGKAEPWIAESAKQRAQLNSALGVMETSQPPAAWTYKSLKIKTWHPPKPRVVVLRPRVVVVSAPVKHVTKTTTAANTHHSDDSSSGSQHSDDGGGSDDGGSAGGGTGGDD
jgi:uncharacterized membrane protein YgcG